MTISSPNEVVKSSGCICLVAYVWRVEIFQISGPKCRKHILLRVVLENVCTSVIIKRPCWKPTIIYIRCTNPKIVFRNVQIIVFQQFGSLWCPKDAIIRLVRKRRLWNKISITNYQKHTAWEPFIIIEHWTSVGRIHQSNMLRFCINLNQHLKQKLYVVQK